VRAIHFQNADALTDAEERVRQGGGSKEVDFNGKF